MWYVLPPIWTSRRYWYNICLEISIKTIIKINATISFMLTKYTILLILPALWSVLDHGNIESIFLLNIHNVWYMTPGGKIV